ncbi:MAG TPA: hypothetical protein PKD85_18035, partial [Saprospiraceae bacterium]|nr:hypothetical protein [Saprospiraceae bacterium]
FLSGISSIFPVLTEYSVAFSVFMIVFEILLEVMLLFGSLPKLTAWLFMLLVLFFTFLTGFTYLTGYVPSDGQFFDFSTWGAYKATNMKVTDCGCFGDFLKLEPKVSFFKDLVLLIPAFLFLFKTKSMHVLLGSTSRLWINTIVTLGFIYFCMSNYVWKLPVFDFRPFKIGADVATQYKKEKEAAGAVRSIARTLKNPNTNETQEISEADYFANLSKLQEDGWTTIDQVMSEPAVPKTKISDFQIKTYDGNDVTDVYLENEKYHFMLISHKIKYATENITVIVKDTLMKVDTIIAKRDTKYIQRIDTIVDKSVDQVKVTIAADILEDYVKDLKGFLDQAVVDGHEISIVLGGANENVAKELQKQLGNANIKIYDTDDILLKTIIRSNPGIVLWKNGKIIYKWHKKQLPPYEKVKAAYLQ